MTFHIHQRTQENLHYTIKELFLKAKQRRPTMKEVMLNCHKIWCKQYTQLSVAYGDKKSFTNKLVITNSTTPPTVDKPELKLYNIQLHKANADGNALAVLYLVSWSRWCDPSCQPIWRRSSDSNLRCQWSCKLCRLEAKDYVIKELTAPAGYQLSNVSITVSAAELTAATGFGSW